jgi:O-antigen/teichoic acid export membrane protein
MIGPDGPPLDVAATGEPPFWERRGWWAQTGRAGVAVLVASVYAFLATVVAARALGPHDYGLVVLALSAVASVATFLDFSLEEAVIHYAARAIAAKDHGAVRALLATSVRMDVLVGVAVFAALALAAGPIASVIVRGGISPMLIRLAALESLAITIDGTTGATLMLSRRPELRAWCFAWTNALRLGAVVLASNLGSAGPDKILIAYVVGSATGSLTQAVAARWVARHRWGTGPRGRPPVGLRTLVWFGMHSSTTTTIIAVRAALISVVLGRIAGAPAVGIFAVALLPLTLAQVASAPLRITMFPEQATLAAEGRIDLLRRAVVGYTRVAVAVALVAAAIGWFVLPPLISTLFAHAFEDALVPARVMLIPAVVALATAWSKSLPSAVGRPEVRTWISIVELGLTGVLLAALASHGAIGAAWAIAITSVLVGSVWVVAAQRILRNAAAGHMTETTPTEADQ